MTVGETNGFVGFAREFHVGDAHFPMLASCFAHVRLQKVKGGRSIPTSLLHRGLCHRRSMPGVSLAAVLDILDSSLLFSSVHEIESNSLL